jgi:hypothetical protein
LANRSFSQIHHCRREIDDPGLAGFLDRFMVTENPNAQRKVHVGGGDAANLAGPATGFLHGKDEIAECLVAYCGHYFLAFLAGQHAISEGLRRLLDVAERVGGKQPFALGPVKRPLDRDHRAAAGALPAGVSIQPFTDVQGLQILDQQRAVQITEILQIALVPVECIEDVVFLGEVEEQVADGGDAERVGLGQFARPTCH